MSDDVFQIATPYPDVASLAQGYINRADGERLLLPLPDECGVGDGARFVVFLADGTPAFAGAGRCAQQSDQGDSVPAQERYETLIDQLQFDERSQPVYDYIVAVRNAAYAQGQGEEGDVDGEAAEDVEDADQDVSVDVSAGSPDEEVAVHEVVTASADYDSAAFAEPDFEDEPTRYSQVDARAADAAAVAAETQVTAAAPDDEAEQVLVHGVETWEAPAQAAPAQPAQPYVAGQPSFIPEPIPTGILTRPSRTVHWAPAPARRPTPRPASGLFAYNGSGLPRPSNPPRPDLDRSLWVVPAPRPGEAPTPTAGVHVAPAPQQEFSEPPTSLAPDEVDFEDTDNE